MMQENWERAEDVEEIHIFEKYAYVGYHYTVGYTSELNFHIILFDCIKLFKIDHFSSDSYNRESIPISLFIVTNFGYYNTIERIKAESSCLCSRILCGRSRIFLSNCIPCMFYVLYWYAYVNRCRFYVYGLLGTRMRYVRNCKVRPFK